MVTISCNFTQFYQHTINNNVQRPTPNPEPTYIVHSVIQKRIWTGGICCTIGPAYQTPGLTECLYCYSHFLQALDIKHGLARTTVYHIREKVMLSNKEKYKNKTLTNNIIYWIHFKKWIIVYGK